jgi:uncharacterized caspase-like protein
MKNYFKAALVASLLISLTACSGFKPKAQVNHLEFESSSYNQQERLQIVFPNKVQNYKVKTDMTRWGLVGLFNEIVFDVGEDLKSGLGVLADQRFKQTTFSNRSKSRPQQGNYLIVKAIESEFEVFDSYFYLQVEVEYHSNANAKPIQKTFRSKKILSDMDDASLIGNILLAQKLEKKLSKVETEAIHDVLVELDKSLFGKPKHILTSSPSKQFVTEPIQKRKNQKPVARSGNYHALIIANQDYQSLTSLITPISDAYSLEKILQNSYGFTTKVITNANRAEIIKSLSYYRKNLKPEDKLLVYYAGHGIIDDEADEGYWMPINASMEDPSNWLANSTITNMIRPIKAQHIMLIADSCYSGKLTRGLGRVQLSPPEVDRLLKKKTRVVLTSGGLEPVLDEGYDGHSVFTGALIKQLEQNSSYVTGTEIFQSLRREVILNADQTPEYSDIRKVGHQGGDFVFFKQ